ncbi:MAG: Spy/CpxP family protein refolding chaperone [Candidatus Hydrogenedentota bacterium]
MWRKAAPLLFLLSVALNAAFVGVWGIRMAQSYAVSEASYDGPVWCPLHRQLEVTPEQWRRIEPQLAAFKAQSEAVRLQMEDLRSEMIAILSAENMDRQALAQKQREIRAVQQRMQELVIRHLLAEKEVLTAAQEAQLFEMMQEQTACSGPGRMLRFDGRDASERKDAATGGEPADAGDIQ